MLNKKFRYIGLARRGGMLSYGADGVISSVKSGKSKLVVIADDVSENTLKRITDKCKYYNAEFIIFGSMSDLGSAIGTNQAACVSITDDNLSKAIIAACD